MHYSMAKPSTISRAASPYLFRKALANAAQRVPMANNPAIGSLDVESVHLLPPPRQQSAATCPRPDVCIQILERK